MKRNRCRTAHPLPSSNSVRDRPRSPVEVAPSRCGCYSRARRPRTAPIANRAPRPNPAHATRPNARSDRWPNQTAPRKPTSTHGRCTPNVRENKASSSSPEQPRAARHSHKSVSQTRNRKMKANRRTSHNRPLARFVLWIEMATPHVRRVHDPAHSALVRGRACRLVFAQCSLACHPAFLPDLLEHSPDRGALHLVRQRPHPCATRVLPGRPRFLHARARWHPARRLIFDLLSGVPDPAAVVPLRGFSAQARKFFLRCPAIACRSRLP